nr:unnamed protein product [Spirometra erinaceieuropaei]
MNGGGEEGTAARCGCVIGGEEGSSGSGGDGGSRWFSWLKFLVGEAFDEVAPVRNFQGLGATCPVHRYKPLRSAQVVIYEKKFPREHTYRHQHSTVDAWWFGWPSNSESDRSGAQQWRR